MHLLLTSSRKQVFRLYNVHFSSFTPCFLAFLPSLPGCPFFSAWFFLLSPCLSAKLSPLTFPLFTNTLFLTLSLYISTQNAVKKLLPLLRELKQTKLTAFCWRSFIKFIFTFHSNTCGKIWVTLLKYFFVLHVIGNFPVVLYYLFCHGKSPPWSLSWVLERKKVNVSLILKENRK